MPSAGHTQSGARTTATTHQRIPRPQLRAVAQWLTHPAWRGYVLGATVSAAAGAATALTMPRGPITPTQVIIAMMGGAAVGVIAGFALRSRWSILLTPLVFILACELVRLPIVGPTVDAPDLSTTFGVLVLCSAADFTPWCRFSP